MEKFYISNETINLLIPAIGFVRMLWMSNLQYVGFTERILIEKYVRNGKGKICGSIIRFHWLLSFSTVKIHLFIIDDLSLLISTLERIRPRLAIFRV